MVLAGDQLEARFPVNTFGQIEFHACVGDQFTKFCEIRGKKLQAAMRQVDVHHPAGADRDSPEVLRRGENSLIVQLPLLSMTPTKFIVRAGHDLCNRIRTAPDLSQRKPRELLVLRDKFFVRFTRSHIPSPRRKPGSRHPVRNTGIQEPGFRLPPE